MRFSYILIFSIFTSCAPPEEMSTTNIGRTPATPSRYLAGDFITYEGVEATIELPDHTPITSYPSFPFSPTLTDGKLSFIPTYDSNVLENNVYEVYLNGNNESNKYILVVNGDPLRKHMWNLDNTGQDGFTLSHGVFGFDINVKDVWGKLGVTGKGIKIAVSDTGVDIDHNDLYKNMKGNHKDFFGDPKVSSYPTPTSPHGTAVASIIGAMGWNNEGITGVAPDSILGGFQFIDAYQGSDFQLIEQASGDYRIFNYSYGDEILYPVFSSVTYLNHLEDSTLHLGKIYVKAAGNSFKVVTNSGVCLSQNANFPLENESPSMIIVGAINAKGEKASYSNSGSNIWVSAPGGEIANTNPAIIAADLSTCFRGAASTSGVTIFNRGGISLNKRCDYMNTMNGTSSATPMVSGVIALMLEKNPNLSSRDIKHILALTSRKIDSTTAEKIPTSCSSFSFGNGWTNINGSVYQKNGTPVEPLSFHNYFGFGLIDAYAAVSMADGFISLPSMLKATVADSSSLPLPNNSSVISRAYSLSDNEINGSTGVGVYDYLVETVSLKISLKNEQTIGDYKIILKSPFGTESILTHGKNFYSLMNTEGTLVLTSNAFYGEPLMNASDLNQKWTVEIINQGSKTGSVEGISLDFTGHERVN